MERLRNLIVVAALFIVLVVSLGVRNPWCAHWCPMRTFEHAAQAFRGIFRKRSEAINHE